MLEKLFFQIGLIDQVTGPAKGVMKEINAIQRTATKGFWNITKGGLAMGGVGYAIDQAIGPALEMKRALGEVDTLDVLPEELKKLERAGDKFAIKFNESSTDFVRSAYDIQSSITGLVNGELAAFTNSSNILSKATKSDAATMTDYMGTMYGIFTDQALAMGKSKWVETITGMTAESVKMFKTTGTKWAQGFSALGSTAEKAGVMLSEQMAIMGNLQATMGGSEAATKYISFIQGIGNAEKTLGLQFTNAQGKMLPTVEILEKIKGKFGDLSKVEDMDVLIKAFGRKEAVAFIQNLIGKTDKLTGDISKLDKVTDQKNAVEMALKRTDAYAKFGAILKVLHKNFGKLIMVGLIPFANILSSGAVWLNTMIDECPAFAFGLKWITIGILGLVAGFGALKISMGVFGLMKAGFMTMKLIVGVTKAWTGLQWLLNAALMANPIGIIIGLIAGLAAGVTALIYYWDDFTAAYGNVWWVKALMFAVDGICSGFTWMKDIILNVSSMIVDGGFQLIAEGIQWLWDSFEQLENGLIGIVNSIGGAFTWLKDTALSILDKIMAGFNKVSAAWDKVKKYSGYNWIKGKLGFGGDDKNPATPKPVAVQSLEKSRRMDIPAGGVTNNMNSSNSRTTNYGGVNIYTSQAYGPADLEEWSIMHAGA